MNNEKIEMKACIATLRNPKDFMNYVDAVKDLAKEKNVEVLGYTIISSHNCANHGIFIEGKDKDNEEFLNALTMSLMPARWEEVSLSDVGVEKGLFSTEL